ncbi:MAG: HAMP domain-containing protein [Candidimonas sp.]|nr:MAG: HAMP domain-containing protein [Candidimonas sp.]
MESLKKRLNDSIQSKLSVVLAVVIAAVTITAGTFSFLSALDEAYERQDDVLYQVADLVGRVQAVAPQALKRIRLQDEDRDSSLSVQIVGGTTAADRNGADYTVPISPSLPDGLHTLNVQDRTFRVLVRTIPTHQRIVVAQDTDRRDAAALHSALRTVTPLLILVPILLIVIADLVRRIFRPTRTMSQEVDARAETDLRPIADDHLPREIRSFVRAINRLLARVSESMEAQGRFIADAAHELRSPTAALSLQAERLGRADMSDIARERLRTLRHGMDRNRHLLTQLLALAKAQNSADAQAPSQARVRDVLQEVLETVLPLAEAKHIDIGVTSNENPATSVSELDLTTLMSNLMDNAIRYTPEGGKIDLCVTTRPGATVLSVSDSGPGIPASERKRIFEPFYRVLGNGQSGSGLGLSIVMAIIRRIGARIELSHVDETTQSGLRVTVTIPAEITAPPYKPANKTY